MVTFATMVIRFTSVHWLVCIRERTIHLESQNMELCFKIPLRKFQYILYELFSVQ
jgi:hypothetical protein